MSGTSQQFDTSHSIADDSYLNMENTLACRFVSGLFGQNSEPAPVWGSRENLTHLAQALASGSSILQATSTTGVPECSHATTTVATQLQEAGRLPGMADLIKTQNLSDEQRIALGFEPRNPWSESMQDMGVPPFKDLNVSQFIDALRFAARMQEIQTGSRPILQVGILTLTVQGIEQQFFAQTLAVEAGEVTDTVWLYRWCIMGLDGQYQEHWRPFDNIVNATNATMQRDLNQSSQTGFYQTATSTDAADQQPQPQPQKRTRKPRTRRFQSFRHQHLSDAELFRAPADLLQGDAILRLSHSYSNQEIFERINANTPNGVRSVNVVTKRLTHAIQDAAKASGRSEREIRAEIVQAKTRNGVKNKSKVNVSPYG